MGTMFNQIFITRTDENGDATTTIRVPITYGPKDKVLNRRITDPELDRPFAAILPYITFQLKRMYYDSERQLNKSGRFVSPNANKNMATWSYNPVPYNFEFELVVMTSNAEDGTKIIEQILPFFDPDFTVTVKLLDDGPEAVMDIVTLLDPVTMEDSYTGEVGATQYRTWTLNLLMKGYLFGPSQKGKIIKVSEANFSYTANSPVYTLTVTPGMTANGTATSNASLSVPYSQIDWTDDYGYIETYTANTLNG